MSAHPQPLTGKRLAALAAGLLVLTGLSIWRLGQTPETGPGPDIVIISGETMGTTYTVKAILLEDGTIETETIRDAIEAVLARVNQGMSTYIEDSEISRFNRAEANTPYAFGEETFGRFESAARVSEETDGAFDITVGPIVNAYGFGPETVVKTPTDVELEALLQRIGHRQLALNNDTHSVSKSRGDVVCDLSAIAKGYGVDAVAEALKELGLESTFVEIGGEVRAAGVKPDGKPWFVGIERPDASGREKYLGIPLRDMSIATSGDYRNYYEEDGRRISHTIDPRTGRSIEHNLASVSVLHENCETADAYATALIVLGPEEGLAFAEMHELAALFLIRTGDNVFEKHASTTFSQYMISAVPHRTLDLGWVLLATIILGAVVLAITLRVIFGGP